MGDRLTFPNEPINDERYAERDHSHGPSSFGCLVVLLLLVVVFNGSAGLGEVLHRFVDLFAGSPEFMNGWNSVR